MARNIFITLFLLAGFSCFSQVPATINYQGLVRDASGTPVTNTVVNLQFKMVSSTNPNFFTENQNAVPVNSLGLFSTKIGINTPLPLTGWENSPITMEVFADVAGSGFQSMGTQILSSVPYALFAKQAGNALPTGTVNGQTLSWNQNLGQWEISSNLTNDNQRVGIGMLSGAMNSKLGVSTTNPFDTTVITAVHSFAQNRTAGIRALVFGNTNSSANPYASALFGSQSGSYNTGNGFGIGGIGYGSSSGGFGIGISGVGSAQTANGTAVGIYGTTDSSMNTTKRYAAIFDKGAVFIGDSLLLNPATNPGNPGYVLTLTGSNGRAKWMPGGGAGSSPWIQKPGYLHMSNNGDFIGIGTGTLMPSARLELNNNSNNPGMFINDAGDGPALKIDKNSASGNAIKLYSATGNSVAAMEVFHSGNGNGIYTYATGGHALFAVNNNSNPTGLFNNAGSGVSLHAEKGTPGTVASFVSSYTTSSSDAVLISHAGFGYALNATSNSTITSNYAGLFNGGIVVRGKNNSYNDFAITGRDGNNNQIFTLRNNGFLTLGQGMFTASKMTIEGNDNTTSFFPFGASPSSNLMIMNLNQTNNNFSSISFAASGTESAKIVAVNLSHTTPRADLVFMTRDPGNINEVLRFTSNGHIKASGTNTNSTCNITTSFGAALSASKGAGSNDIRGEVLATITGSAVVPAGGSITVTVPFDKPYSLPYILIQALNQEAASLSQYISSVNATSFTVQFFNNTQSGLSFTGLKFKYFVVE